MTARIGLNEIPYFSWKGKTIKQITGSIRRNSIDSSYNSTLSAIFRPLPIDGYRKEIANVKNKCNGRTSIKLDDFYTPGANIVFESTTDCSYGLVNTYDLNLVNNSTDKPGVCKVSSDSACISRQNDALRRVRSSGMIRKKYSDSNGFLENYCTDSSQYLNNRNKSYYRNSYHYIRQGTAGVIPGDSLSKANIYITNAPNVCSKFHLESDCSFQYQWIDGYDYTVSLSAGYYDIEDLNNTFKLKMISNKHYYRIKQSGVYVFLLEFGYNSTYDRIQIICRKTDTDTFSSTLYDYPAKTSSEWYTPTGTLVPRIIIAESVFSNMVGIDIGEYPTEEIDSAKYSTGGEQPSGSNIYTSDQTFVGTKSPRVKVNYTPIYYKPSNYQFANQGAVSSSSHIARVKYNIITTNGINYRNSFGPQVANALAYGVPVGGYTGKDQNGYPEPKTPVINKYTGELKSCPVTKMRNG